MSKNNGTKPKVITDLSGLKAALDASTPPSIIHHRGTLNKVTFEGKEFTRQESIYMRSYGLVKCADYDEHFIMYDPSRLGWTTFCTCGSEAVITGYDAYKQDASPQGMLLVCLRHASTGKHNPVNKK